jgi:NAD(P)-dependent dehydrogenase (short-subunit alcohol dehydrogenase family)
VFLACQAEGRGMLRAGGGSIVNIGSISGTIVNRGINQIHYNSSKAAVLQLSRSLAVEWADRGIRVNVLSPGYVRTGMARGVQTTRSFEDFLDDIPMRRLAEPVEMVGAAVFLLSDAASYCTGSELMVDGGVTRW